MIETQYSDADPLMPNLEKLGDEAVNLAKQACELAGLPSFDLFLGGPTCSPVLQTPYTPIPWPVGR